jgi:hypothetical protein
MDKFTQLALDNLKRYEDLVYFLDTYYPELLDEFEAYLKHNKPKDPAIIGLDEISSCRVDTDAEWGI